MESRFSDDVYEALQIESCVRGRKTYSGTAPESVSRQCADGERLLRSEEAQISAWEDNGSSCICHFEIGKSLFLLRNMDNLLQ